MRLRILVRTLLCILLVGTLAIAQTDEPNPQKSKANEPSESLCPDARSQGEMNQCMAAAYDSADKDLNQFYSELTKKLDADAVAKLQSVQRAWIKYRDANCEAEASLYDGGSIVPATRSACLERNTRARIAELHRVYDTGSR